MEGYQKNSLKFVHRWRRTFPDALRVVVEGYNECDANCMIEELGVDLNGTMKEGHSLSAWG